MSGNQESAFNIWKPVKTRPTETPLPYPNSKDTNNLSKTLKEEKFTRTQLVHHDSHTSAANQQILTANKSYNSSPKPFVRKSAIFAPPPPLPKTNFSSNKQQFANENSKSSNSLQFEANYNQKNSQQQANSFSTTRMSPKLVPLQYNSPIDLYSMSNIRKTIEAHSEMIAPGVKGINFLKEEPPINKKSEVLKLIKEEEEERRRLQQSSPSSSSGRTSGLTPQVSEARSAPDSSRRVLYASEQANSGNLDQDQPSRSILKPTPSNATVQSSTEFASGAPKCFECGQAIVGPFAKLQEKFIHPQCFNCSTCGTSLKNIGYFTISDKLYCDIHARQVANVMRLNFNFEPNKQAVVNNQQELTGNHRSEPRAQQVLVEKSGPIRNKSLQLDAGGTTSDLQVNNNLDSSNAITTTTTNNNNSAQSSFATNSNAGGNLHCSQCCSGSKNQAATTISTMFSRLGHHCQQCNNHCSCKRRSEIRWTWRPAETNKCLQHQQFETSHQLLATTGSSAMTSASSISEQKNKHESHLQAFGNNTTTTNTVPIIGGRAPFCCHCHLQIYGPYILAGKSTWCKPCSQTNFVCNSCHRSLLNIGFIEDSRTGKFNCEHCFETHLAPMCSKCNTRIMGDCLNALGKRWHPSCFICGHCKGPFGNSSFYLEDNVPYCERDWNLLFTTKCFSCNYPIEAGDKWIEALERNYHSDCFRCAGCQVKLEGTTFFCKAGKPYCRMHAS